MKKLDRYLTEICDRDENWKPFLFLRPPRKRKMSSAHVALYAAMIGLSLGMAANILVELGPEPPHLPAWMLPAGISGLYFMLYRFSFARAWNRRAERLAKLAVTQSRNRVQE